jgi:hypothetical protein
MEPKRFDGGAAAPLSDDKERPQIDGNFIEVARLPVRSPRDLRERGGGKESRVTSHQAVDYHTNAAAHLRTAAEHSERAAELYAHGNHEQAAHFALLAHAHMQHAGQFMSDAAKIHAELHGGNKHTLIG